MIGDYGTPATLESLAVMAVLVTATLIYVARQALKGKVRLAPAALFVAMFSLLPATFILRLIRAMGE